MSILTAEIRRSLIGNAGQGFYENSQFLNYQNKRSQQNANLDSLAQIRADLRERIGLFN